MTFADIPAVNASFNGLSALLLAAGFVFIKRGNKIAHRNCMVGALASSTLFLVGYLTYHATVKTITHFTNPPEWRPVYLAILLTHTVLAVVIVPMILTTLTLALWNYDKGHQIVGRLSVRLWLLTLIIALFIFVMTSIRANTYSHFNGYGSLFCHLR